MQKHNFLVLLHSAFIFVKNKPPSHIAIWPWSLPESGGPSAVLLLSRVALWSRTIVQVFDQCGLGKELPVGFLRWGAPQTWGGGWNTGQPDRGTGSRQELTEQPG